MPNPRFPIYIPSKSRATLARTPRYLDLMGVPYRLVIEEPQYADYNRYFPAEKLLILDPTYKKTYNLCMTIEEGQSTGPGPARNFIWDHAKAEGTPWYWTMDDNIEGFYYLNKNQRIKAGDGSPLHAMEEFVLRYKNIAMAGPAYLAFTPARVKQPPFIMNTRIYSCNLIRTDITTRWRGRYNEDTILSLDLLKAGWCTVQFNAYLQDKIDTQVLPGGNTEAFYAEEGTLPKSQMLVNEHPDVAKLAMRFGRVHHYVNYSPWKKRGLIKDPNYTPPENNPYKLKKIEKNFNPDKILGKPQKTEP